VGLQCVGNGTGSTIGELPPASGWANKTYGDPEQCHGTDANPGAFAGEAYKLTGLVLS
jgi:hypothetical protein